MEFFLLPDKKSTTKYDKKVIFALVLMNQTEKIITVTENCITFVLVGVFLVCKAHSGGIHMFEDVYGIMSVATHLF